MKNPLAHLHGHLTWTRTGTVWATWQLSPLPYALRPTSDQYRVRTLHRALLRALRGEALLLGLMVDESPVDAVHRMLAGTEPGTLPDWDAECAASLERFEQENLGRRAFFLSIPLRERTPWKNAQDGLTSVTGNLLEAVGLPRGAPTPTEIQAKQAAADAVARFIPAAFDPRPVTPAHMVWMHNRAQTRGTVLDDQMPPLPEPDGRQQSVWTPPQHPDASTQSAGGALVPDAILDEGGRSDLPARAARRWNPTDRRYLKVTSQTTSTPSYQAFLTMADLPPSGMAFPGQEALGHLDDSGMTVDLGVRILVRGRAETAAKNRRAIRVYNDQLEQQSSEEGRVPRELLASHDAHERLEDELSSDKEEIEVHATSIFAVSGPDPDTATTLSSALQTFYADQGFKTYQPLGRQEQLYAALLPGVPRHPVVSSLAQVTTSDAYAAMVPVIGSPLGSQAGPVIARNISTGLASLVHLDLIGATEADMSASVAICGELGSGKSSTAKTIASMTVDLGGRIVAVDRSAVGEWVKFAGALTDAKVASLRDPQYSLDMLRMFSDPLAGARTAQTFLTQLLNLAPTDMLGQTLAEALAPEYRTRHGLHSLGHLLTHLQTDSDLPDAHELGRRLNMFAAQDLGRVVFDPDLPPLELSSRALVFHTAGVDLPHNTELLHEHLFKQMSLEKIFGRAFYALIAVIAQQVAFGDNSELAGFFIDETHHVASTVDGEHALVNFVRDGRKHAAFAVLSSHGAGERDFGSEELRGLIPFRLVMRLRDRHLAGPAIDWLGLNPDDPDLVDLVTLGLSPLDPVTEQVPPQRRGEGLMRDDRNNFGKVQVLPPSAPARAEAVLTTPKITRRAADEQAGAS